MKRKGFLLLVLLVAVGWLVPAPGQGETKPGPVARIAASRQLIVMETADWGTIEGRLQRFEREPGNRAWKAVDAGCPVLIGRTGLAWDDSQPNLPKGPVKTESDGRSPIKREGDGKSPAGAFGLVTVFGKAKYATANYPFLELNPHLVGVDDPHSQHYNQIVDRTAVKVDWTSAEKMWISPYDLGAIVDYNVLPATPGRGSCIFVHIWDEGEPTSGCTSMELSNLQVLCNWLRSSEHPVLVQLPQPVYQELRPSWDLPALAQDFLKVHP